MKCLLCKTNDCDCFDSGSKVKKYFCKSCFWNDDNHYDSLEDLVNKHKEDEMNRELIVHNIDYTKLNKPQTNAINPNYYKWHPVCEAVKITQEFTTNLGCVINYIWRVASPDARKYDSKEGRIQDLQKAIRHLEFEIERIKEE